MIGWAILTIVVGVVFIAYGSLLTSTQLDGWTWGSPPLIIFGGLGVMFLAAGAANL